jgi:LPS sulfotransferase NodH
VGAVGFKLFYYHAHTAQWQPLWEYLAAQSALKVLHIKRDNLLAVHLSRKRAAMTDRWVNTSGTREEHAPITLDYAECLADFVQTRLWEDEYARFFAHLPILEIHYEALARDSAGEMARVQNFLGVRPQSLAPDTYRQSDRPLSASIANYAELKAQFNNSPWQAFFEE